MFAYLINRWSFARRFEKHGSGYLYRRRPDLPGFIVSEDERGEALREFRERYWKSWLLMLLLMLAGALAVGSLALAFELEESSISMLSFPLLGGVAFLVFKQQGQRSLAIEQRFQSNPVVPSDLPPTGWVGRFNRLSRERSWLKHAAFILIYGSIAWILTPSSMDTTAEHWFLFICFFGSTLVLVYGAFHKAVSLRDAKPQ